MYPDPTDWEPDDLRWHTTIYLGVWQDHTDPAAAARFADNAAGLGWPVTIEPPLPAPVAWYRAVDLAAARTAQLRIVGNVGAGR
jgi:hypothetical protein